MTIYLGNLTVTRQPSRGTVIGPLSADKGNTKIPCSFTQLCNRNHYFAISGNNLVTAQSGGMVAGQYSVQCNGDVGNLDRVDDDGTRTAAFAPAITLTPASVTVADNVPAGTVRATATATMSDGSQISGTLTISNTDFFVISGFDIVTARALTSADDGPQTTV